MFTEEKIFFDTVTIARKDIRGFFDSDFKFDFDHTNYTSFLDILRQIDATYFSHRFNGMGSLEFVDNLIKWLEDTRKEPRYPWEERDGNLKLSQDEKVRKIHSFLTYLKRWVNQLVAPGDLRSIGYGTPFLPGHKFCNFTQFIGQKRLVKEKWYIHIHEANKDDKKLLKGFVSWLVLVKSQPVLYIIYDREKLLSHSNLSVGNGGNGSIVCRSRNRRIILHELGHARTELSWYLSHVNAAQDTTWLRSHPIHEYKAWTYAFTIKATLVCIRSRITRFIDEGDPEWLSYV